MKKKGYLSRIDFVRTKPYVTTFTFETGYSRTQLRISYDSAFGKFWIQIEGHPTLVSGSLSNINLNEVSEAILSRVRRDRAERMGGYGIVVTSGGAEQFYIHDASLVSKDLLAFARHIINEFETRYVPSIEEVMQELVAGFDTIAEDFKLLEAA